MIIFLKSSLPGLCNSIQFKRKRCEGPLFFPLIYEKTRKMKKKEKTKAKSHESMATEIIQKRIEILNNKKCKTALTIHNINNDGKTGTEVVIRFPYKEEF